jgi:ATP-dependent helicase/nuclease subunit B
MTKLFDPAGPSVFSIPAGADFLGELAKQLAQETDLANNPEALADALIYVPNRRSERTLAFALHQAAGGKACLLPNIRALGDLETSDPPPSAEAALANLPPVISPAARIGALTRLVMQYFDSTGSPLPAVSCLSAARELARLLDQAALSGDVDWTELSQLVPDADLSVHWQQSVEFLKIITDLWPARLDEATAMDPYARRFAAAEAMTRHWQDNPPQAPVIIAGSTGATPASRLLMRAAMAMPKGLVVLPGLDLALQPSTLNQIAETPSHPQYTLARTLVDLELTPQMVQAWPLADERNPQTRRRRLVHEALAPAQSTADWTARLRELATDRNPSEYVRDALEGLNLIEASDDSEEAWVAALLLRETLEYPDRTAALVTPDAGLARRVSAMLKRWNIDVAPSAGLPLSQTKAGSLALLVSTWLLDPSHPVNLMAVLQHPASRFAPDGRLALDKFFLRGPRTWSNWEELIAVVDLAQNERQSYRPLPEHDLFETVQALLKDLSEILMTREDLTQDIVSGDRWFQAVAETMTEVAKAPQPWTGEDGAALSRLLRDLVELTAPLGEQTPTILTELLEAEAQSLSVSSGEAHPRFAIWGPLEARLQTADRLILAGLNEGVWPEQPPADAFLPRVFRAKIGLADPDERIGLSAHDFAQLASAPHVTLLSSKRRDDKPALASRWLWRLKTLVRGALKEQADAAFSPPPGQDPIVWLRDMETAPALPSTFTAEPRPMPPTSARPKRLSVTRIEQLVRDPYAIYCESVLNLRPLDALNLPPDARVRGTAIHKALERFEIEATAPTAEALLSLLEMELRRGGEAESDLIALRDQRRRVCADYIGWRAEQSHELQGTPYTEMRGELAVQLGEQLFVLSGTADRIERRADGAVAILDFKTGRPPSEKQVRLGLSPQMPLQGLIAREGGYDLLGKSAVTALTYIRFGTQFDVTELGAPAPRAKLDAMPVAELISDAEIGLRQLLVTFENPQHPYLSAPRPERVTYESAYTRLARRAEWAGLTTYD